MISAAICARKSNDDDAGRLAKSLANSRLGRTFQLKPPDGSLVESEARGYLLSDRLARDAAGDRSGSRWHERVATILRRGKYFGWPL